MTTKIRQRARREQDYWLTYCDKPGFKEVTEEERMEFYLFDSQGKPCSMYNPILWGKGRHGQYMALYRQFDKIAENEGWWTLCQEGMHEVDQRLLEAAFGVEGAQRRRKVGQLLTDIQKCAIVVEQPKGD